MTDAAPELHVVVPVRDQWAHTKALLACLDQQTAPHTVHVLDNGSSRRGRDALLRASLDRANLFVEPAQGLTIYECWNRGFWLASQVLPGEPFHVLVTNNDVLLPPHALAQLSAALLADESRWAAYPDYSLPFDDTPRQVALNPPCVHTHGVWGSNGMSGWCFMLAGERLPWRPLCQDLSYEWWYGDNALARAIERGGGQQARVLGLRQWHAGSATERKHDLGDAKARDRERWNASERALRHEAPPAQARARAAGHRVVTRRDWRRSR